MIGNTPKSCLNVVCNSGLVCYDGRCINDAIRGDLNNNNGNIYNKGKGVVGNGVVGGGNYVGVI